MAQRDQEFYRLAGVFIDRMLEEAPTAATHLGDHRYDARLGRHTKEDIERKRSEVAKGLKAFRALPSEELSPQAAIDWEVMVGLAKSFLRGFEVPVSYTHLTLPTKA